MGIPALRAAEQALPAIRQGLKRLDRVRQGDLLGNSGQSEATARAALGDEQARPGQQLGIGGPRGSFVVPKAFDWHVLIGDETALPAIARRLEELPATAQALVLIEVPAQANEIPLPTSAKATMRWLHRNGTAPGYSTLLLEAARDLALPQGEGYVWVAAESSTAKAVREIMVAQHGIDKSRIRAASYWKRGAVAVHESHDD